MPIIRSWALTRGFALHPGTRNRYEIRYTRTQHRPPSLQANDHDRVSGTHTPKRGRAAEKAITRTGMEMTGVVDLPTSLVHLYLRQQPLQPGVLSLHLLEPASVGSAHPLRRRS